MDKGFDGDFDGDSVAIVKLRSDKAHTQALEMLSVEANLLDLGAREVIAMDARGDTEELHPLMMQDSLDVKVTQHVAPRFVEQFGQLTMRANEIHDDYLDGLLSSSARREANREIMHDLSTYYRTVMEGQYGDAALVFTDPVAHLESVRVACIETGAKGSPAKLAAYAKHLGVDEHGVDRGQPLHTREEDQGVMVATAVKTAVGIAGAYSQRGVKALRNVTQKSVLELTYPVTQSLLQSKHDPHEAMHKYNVLLSSARELWRGHEMTRVAGPDGEGSSWAAVVDKDGVPIQASPQAWEESFLDMYRSKDGLNIASVNPEHVHVVAQALTGPDGKMRDIEAVGDGSDYVNLEDGSEYVNSAVLDRLAYGGSFNDVCMAARTRENLFDGELNAQFAPHAIVRNRRENEQYQRRVERAADDTRAVPGPEYVDVDARDVLSSDHALSKQHGGKRASALAVAVMAPRMHMELPDVPQDCDEPSAGYDREF